LQTAVDGGFTVDDFTVDDFTVDEAAGTVSCPNNLTRISGTWELAPT